MEEDVEVLGFKLRKYECAICYSAEFRWELILCIASKQIDGFTGRLKIGA